MHYRFQTEVQTQVLLEALMICRLIDLNIHSSRLIS